MDTVSFLGLKRPGRGVDHPPPSSAEVEGRVELYIYSPFGPSWPVLGWALPLSRNLRMLNRPPVCLCVLLQPAMINSGASFLNAFAWFRKAVSRFALSLRVNFPSAWNNRHPAGRICVKFYVERLLLTCIEKIQVWLKSDEKQEHYMKACWRL